MTRLIVPIAAALAFLTTGPSSAHADEQLTERDIKRVASEHAAEIRRCYERHAMDQDRATGEVVLSMVVERSGEVRRKSIDIHAPGVGGKRFYRCVRADVKSWQFPRIDSPTLVEYPFLFHHTRAPGAGPTS